MAAAQYVTNEEFTDFVDARLLANLAADTGSDGVVNSSEIITDSLKRASSDVQSYALRGGRYSADDLDALDTAEDYTLFGLVADRALWYLFFRRGGDIPDAVQKAMDATTKTLGELRDGKQVFNDSAAIAAGQPSVSVVSETSRTVTDFFADTEFFPHRPDRVA